MDDELKKLAGRLADGSFDKSSAEKYIDEYRNESKDDEFANTIKVSLKRVAEMLKKFPEKEYPAEYSYLKSRAIHIELRWASIKPSFSSQYSLLKKSKDLNRNHKSSAAHSTYLSSLLYRIVSESNKSNDMFSEIYNIHYRVMSYEAIIAITAMVSPEYNAYIREDDNMRLWINEEVTSRGYFPRASSAEFWLLLNALNHDYEDKERLRLLNVQSAAYDSVLEEKTNANQETLVITKYIRMLMDKNIAEANALINQSINAGLKLPEAMLGDVKK
jgi:hypothetical protein